MKVVGGTTHSRRKSRKNLRKEKKARRRTKPYSKSRNGKESCVGVSHTQGEDHEAVPEERGMHVADANRGKETKRKAKLRARFGIKAERSLARVESSSRRYGTALLSSKHGVVRLSKGAARIANTQEDREIVRLEKKLGMKKGKRTLPASFRDEGLDFLLEVADGVSTNTDSDVDEANETETPTQLVGPQRKRLRVDNPSDTATTSGTFDGQTEGSVNETTNICTDDTETSVSRRYMPPHLRQSAESSKQNESVQKLHRVVRGLVNRLSESNVRLIAKEVEQLYQENSRNNMNRTLSDCLFASCVSTSHVGDQVLMDSMLLLGLTHTCVGVEVSSYFLERLAKKLEAVLEHNRRKPTKAPLNIVLLFAFLYTLDIIHCCLVYDLVRKFVASFQELDIELLLMLLSWVGPQLRRDDPCALKDIVIEVEMKASHMPPELMESSRVKFMLDTIAALKNNNLRKIKQYDASRIEGYKQHYQNLTRGRKSAELQLRMGLSDLLNADKDGRWWIVGSHWSGGQIAKPARLTGQVVTTLYDSKLLTLAQQQRMTSDVKRAVFCVIMSSDDYLDAFEKLLKLNLKEKQAREIVHVVVDCCLQERVFNPFYGYLSEKLCQFSRSYQITFQYNMWDRLKAMASLTDTNRQNLAKLLTHLFSTKALSMSILKIVDFSILDQPSVHFCTLLLQNILSQPVTVFQPVFARVAAVPELNHLRDGLRAFMSHYLVDNKESKLKKMIQLAEESLT